jgi:hypothetical protein
MSERRFDCLNSEAVFKYHVTRESIQAEVVKLLVANGMLEIQKGAFDS